MATQVEIADALGIDHRAVARFAERWGIKYQDAPLSACIRMFWRALSESAAGRKGAENGEVFDLATERAKTERLRQEEIRLKIQEKSRALVPAEEFKLALVPMMQAIRTNVLAIPGKVVQQAKALKGVDLQIEFIEDIVYEALKACAETDVRSIVDSVLESGEGDDASA